MGSNRGAFGVRISKADLSRIGLPYASARHLIRLAISFYRMGHHLIQRPHRSLRLHIAELDASFSDETVGYCLCRDAAHAPGLFWEGSPGSRMLREHSNTPEQRNGDADIKND